MGPGFVASRTAQLFERRRAPLVTVHGRCEPVRSGPGPGDGPTDEVVVTIDASRHATIVAAGFVAPGRWPHRRHRVQGVHVVKGVSTSTGLPLSVAAGTQAVFTITPRAAVEAGCDVARPWLVWVRTSSGDVIRARSPVTLVPHGDSGPR